ncbi:restriction endonuclease subunit S [Hafnia paralvei]|uniref:restriction endonuclease subunit S n=1 Tax=Hafnia paralvei TaxID=546367 RepID=UPI000FBFDCC9
MAKYKAYPEYKDSGVEWLGKIPDNWYITKLKFVANLLTSKSSNEDELFVGLENISSGDGKYLAKDSTLAEGISISFKNNDVLFGKLRPYLAKSWLATFSGVCSSEFLVLRTERLHPRFLNYYLLTKEFIDQVDSSTYGSKMPRASWEFISLLPVPTCSYFLSDKIASFLDHETAKIDNLIEKQQQLIELLKEKRQAVISHAVTKGLNPDVPMKDSGVEWLGEVPEHWVPSRLKYHTRQIVDGAHFTPTYTEIGIPFLRVTDIQDESINFDNIKFIPEHEHKELIKRCKPESGDLLLSKNGTIGVPKLITWNWEFSIFVSLCLIKFKETLTPEYSEYFFKSHEIKEQISGLVKQSTVINLHLDKIQNFWFCIPSLEEQWKIVNFLNEQTKTLDGLVESAEVAIQLMQERRTALISAAVTGKIDVRDWVAPDASDIEISQEAIA